MTESTEKGVLLKLDEGLRRRIAHEQFMRKREMAAADLKGGGDGMPRPLPRTRVLRDLLVLALDECARRRGEPVMTIENVGTPEADEIEEDPPATKVEAVTVKQPEEPKVAAGQVQGVRKLGVVRGVVGTKREG